MTDTDDQQGQEVPPDAQGNDDEDGAALLDAVYAKFTKHVVFANAHQPVAVTVWTAATHGLPAWSHATRLCITSPMRRCAKSRLLDITAAMSYLPMKTGDASAPAVFRSIGDNDAMTPTLFLDEADTAFGTKKAADQNEDLRGLFNCGYQRDRPTIRCVGPQHTPQEFNTFSMAALAAIKSLPDTITDRAVNIALKRRAPGEKVSPFRLRRDSPGLKELHDRLHAWVRDPGRLAALGIAEPTLPVEDRAADAWESLVAIADAAGGDWPQKVRDACRALVAAADSADEDRSTALQLLTDIRQIFTDQKKEFIASMLLVGALLKVDESPWSEFELTQNKLARRLREYGIKPGPDKTGKVRGYRLEALQDAFGRYLTPSEAEDPLQTVNTSKTSPDQGESFDASEPAQECPSNNNSNSGGVFDGLTVHTAPQGAQSPVVDFSAPRCATCGRDEPDVWIPSNSEVCGECQGIISPQQTATTRKGSA